MTFFRDEADYKNFLEGSIRFARREIEAIEDRCGRFGETESAKAAVQFQKGLLAKWQNNYRKRYGQQVRAGDQGREGLRQMSVTIREKRPGEWWVFIHHRRNRTSRKVGDRRTAEQVAERIRARLVLGDFKIGPDKTTFFREYADRWIGTAVPAISKKSTLVNYTYALRKHVLPVFRDIPVQDITRTMVKEHLMKKAKSLEAGTIKAIRTAISGPLSLALDEGVIQANPAQRLGKVTRDKMRDLPDPLTRKELRLLLDTFEQHFPRYYPLCLTLARTGMRLGEVLALQWGDVDFNGGFITVRRNLTANAITTPKTNRIRRVDISPQLLRVLKDLKKARRVESIDPGGWVFCSERGGIVHQQNWRDRVFARALEKAGLRHVRTHDLRHGYATELIQVGTSLAYVRDQLGHRSIKQTVDTYTHLIPGGNKNAVNILDDDAPIRTPGAPRISKKSVNS